MRLSLRWKIVGGFGVVLALVAVLSWVTLALFGSLQNVQRRVFADAIPGLIVVDEIVRSYTAQSAAIARYLSSAQPTLLAQYRAEVEIAELYEERARDLFESGEERALLSQLVAAGTDFHQLVDDDVVPLVQEGNRSRAFRILDQEAGPQIAEIERLGDLLREAQDETLVQTQLQVRSSSNQIVLILVVVTLAVVGAGIVVAVVLSRRYVAHLEKLVDAARAIGRGDLDQEIEIHSGDEVEELAERFVEMQAGLKRLQQLALQDRELEIAASIQRNLLQRSLPQIEGVTLFPMQRQANLVGGDWYDVDVDGSRLTFAVGDASGKGIGAALMATVTLSALRAERRSGARPARVVRRANSALKDATEADSFTTLVYATLDVASGEVTWLNMGHPAPFVLRAARGTNGESGPRGYYLEGPRNRALGWFEDPGYTETRMRLQVGDRLFIFTDGFLEAKSPDGEVFGEHRLADALNRFGGEDLDTVAAELVRTVETFAAGKLDDDLTMLVVDLQGVPGRPAEAMATPDGEEETWPSRR